jgi:microtubule-associated protein-like 6
VHGRRTITTVALGTIARTVDYSPDGTLLAIGFGGRIGKGKEKGGGMLRLYSADPSAPKGVQKLDEKTDAKEWISDVKFSADGRTLAVGAHDCKIYIYSVSATATGATLKLRTTFAKHNSVINHLDLSADGRFMQSNCR